ncbi:hypothetical protein D9M68_858110 [compost metagenome]
MEDLPRGLEFTSGDTICQAYEVAGADMRRGGDGATSAHAQGGEDLRVLAGQHIQLAVGDQRQGGFRVAAAILDRHHPGVTGELAQGGQFQAHAGAVRDVVEDHRYARGVGDGAEPGQQALLGGADVVRRGHQYAGDGSTLHVALEAQQLG